MSDYKEVVNCEAIVGKEKTAIPVEVFSKDVFNRGFYLPLEDVMTVIKTLIAGQDPTKSLMPSGRRPGFASLEESQAHLQAIVRNYMFHYGEMFRCPEPTWFDKRRKKLCVLNPDSAFSVLYNIGFSAGLPNFTILSKNLYQLAVNGSSDWPERTVHPLAYMADNYSIYLRFSETEMLHITADDVRKVDLGTDNVIISGTRMGDLPPLEELLELMDELAPSIGNSILRLVPDSPLTVHYKTRFAHDDALSFNQAHTMALSRFLFMFASAQHPHLWPIELFTGDADSGKSTLPEKRNAILRGDARKVELDAMPIKMRDFIGLVTKADYIVLDNVDSVFEDAAAEYINMVCRMASGCTISLNVLYMTNTTAEYFLMKHTALTARANPFDRDDVLRRILHMKMAAGTGKESKTLLMKAVVQARPQIWAEILLRLQNMVKAHQANAAKQYTLITKMAEYEAYTMICSEFEGSLDETVALWTAYNGGYKDSITMDNGLVASVLMWLGQDPNRAGNVYSSTRLHAGLLAVHKEIGIEFPYKYANSFGKAITANLVALKAGAGLHVRRHNTKGTREIVFTLTPEMMEIAKEAYIDVRTSPTGPLASVIKRRPSLASLKLSS